MAEGDLRRGYGKDMSLISRDFLAEARSATSARIDISEHERVTQYRFSYRSELKTCVDLGDVPTDKEFDTMVDSLGGRVFCNFYESLGEVRIETSALLSNEAIYLQGKSDEAKAAIKRNSGPESLKRFLEQQGAIPPR